MKMKKKHLLILVTAIFLSSLTYAQQISPYVIAPAGSEGAGNEIHLQWTLGELMTQTFGGADLLLTQGFHQPYMLVTSIGEPGHDIRVEAYPNPATDFVHIRLQEPDYADFKFRLFDEQGRQVSSNKLEGIITEVSLKGKQAGVYFLVITKTNQEVSIFKIIKNQ